MNKLFFLGVALILSLCKMNAQRLEFVYDGKVLEDGAMVEVTELHHFSGDYYYLNPEVNLRNTGEEAVDFTLTVSNLEGELLAFCGIDGSCVAPTPGVPMEKSGTIHPNETMDLDVHTMAFWNPKEAGYSKVRYELKYGGVTKTVTAVVDYKPSLISEVEFVHDGKVLENDATVEITELKELAENYYYLDPEIHLRNTGDAPVDFTVSVTNIEGELLAFCGVDGSCIAPTMGVPIVKSGTIDSNESMDLQVHTMAFWNPAQAGYSVVRYELTYGDVIKTVTARIDYEPFFRQNLDFVHNNEIVADGATVEVTELHELNADYYQLNPEINLRNTEGVPVDFTLSVTNLEGELLAFCGIDGVCAAPTMGVPIVKSGTINPNETMNLDVHTMAFWNPEEAGYSKVRYELKYGDVMKTVTAVVDYKPSPVSELEFVYDNVVLENGARIGVEDFESLSSGCLDINPHVLIRNSGDESVDFTLIVTMLDGELLSYCGFDEICKTPSSYNIPISKSSTLPTGQDADPNVCFMEPWDADLPFNSIIKYELVYGDVLKTLIVEINYSPYPKRCLDFVHAGEVLGDGDVAEIAGLTFLPNGYCQVNPGILVKNTGLETVEFALTVTIVEGELLSYCGLDGICNTPTSVGIPMEKQGVLYENQAIDPDVKTLGDWDVAEECVSTVLYTLVYDDVVKTVTAAINYYPPTVSIDDVNAAKSVFVAGNQVVYSFDAPAARQLNVYSVTGALVKQEALESAGTVSLNALGKGIYLYEVVENGERVAARKCVVR